MVLPAGNSGERQAGVYTAADFAHSPFIVFYEVTQACDLACRHCRACAQPQRHPEELSPLQSQALIAQLATFPKPPLLVFTGGDPLKRDDIFDLIRYAGSCGLQTALTPSATRLATSQALRSLQQAGLGRLAVSLDSVEAAIHDRFRGVPGSFARTLEIIDDARALGLPVQVNTTVTRSNADQIDAMAELLAGRGIGLWSLFFLVPVGRGLEEERLTPEEYEQVFERLWFHARRQPFAIKTTEAHHYRRFVLQRGGQPQRGPAATAPTARPAIGSGRAPLGVNDGKGVMFVSHLGWIHPSGFLPLRCGWFPQDSVVEIYQNHPLFRSLRDAEQLGGKCGACEFKQVCGGSRARAYAVTGDPLAAEPDCSYLPKRWQSEALACSP